MNEIIAIVAVLLCSLTVMYGIYNIGYATAQMEEIKKRLYILDEMEAVGLKEEMSEDWFKGVCWVFNKLRQ